MEGLTSTGPGPILGEADAARRRGLRRMRTIALGLLVLAAVVFVLTHGHGGGWGYVNAAAEAAMVGAVADWFAVTALFRHPLGLPVPHTAIIPERKDSIGRSLEDFVTDNFLTAENVQMRLAAAQVPLRIGGWLTRPGNAERVVRESAPALARGLQSVDDQEVADLLERIVLPRLAREPIAPLGGHLLEGILQDRSHVGLVDLAIREIYVWVQENEDTIASIIGARAPWWSPKWLDDTVIARIHVELMSWLKDVRDDPDHQMRQALDHFLGQLAHDLQHDPSTMAKAESLKEHVLAHPSVSASLVSLWGSVRQAIVEALLDEHGELRARLVRALRDLGGRLTTDAELRESLDRRLGDVAGHVVSTYGHEISTVISQTIDRWDGDEASRRIELHVGRDLQFIRINGTVVGGLVGLLIHALAQFL